MIEEFKTYISNVRGYSHHTATAYGKDLVDFAHFMREQREEARWSTVRLEDVEAFAVRMRREGKSPATINRHLSSLRQFYNWLKRQGLLPENPLRYAEMQKLPKRIVNTIPVDDLKQAISSARGTVKVMLTLLCATGIRVQEMLEITKADIEADEQRIKIHGKGNRERYVYLKEKDMKTVTEWAAQSDFKLFGEIEQRAARKAIYVELTRKSSARQLSPHAIRHTFATVMAKNGANVSSIASVLGHQSIRTTQKYIDMAQLDTREIMTKTAAVV